MDICCIRSSKWSDEEEEDGEGREFKLVFSDLRAGN